MVGVEKYDFSFTGFSLRVREMVKVANAELNQLDFDAVSEIGGGKSSTTKKFLNEINKRLNLLTPTQKQLLVNGDLSAQKQIAFLSMCKAHGFVRDFVVEVLREKVLIFDYHFTDGEYLSFYRRKLDEHSEMDDLSELSEKKIRQVLLRTLEESGYIDSVKRKQIQPQIIDDNVINAVVDDDSQWLKVFLVSDLDIENLAA